MLTRLNKAESAAIVMQRILQAFSQPLEINQQELTINVSIGAAIYPDDGQDAASLLQNADHALQTAKENNQSHQFYHEKIHTDSKREFVLSTGLKRENLFHEFIIYYQPVINTKDKSIFAVEAQLHWQHGELGLIKPQELFDYAEKQGKINFITLWLLEKACKQFLSWRSIGFHAESLMISLSVNQLQNSQFIYQISKTLQNCAFNPQWLLLEIRNTNSYASFDALEKALNMLKYLHIQLAINDAGLFSINKLKKISADYLMLDNELMTDENQREFLEAMVKLTNSLHLKIIVKGVLSSQQTRLLAEAGCHLIQGNAPMLEKEMAEHFEV
jgi:EAL domain-containing protein (putative c-di-GMP-specific phosphodiesterase class I)